MGKGIWKGVRLAMAVICAVVFIPIISEFFIELAKARGLYNDPIGTVETALTFLRAVAVHPAFSWVAGIIFGFTFGIWLDAIFRKVFSETAPVAAPIDHGEIVEFDQTKLNRMAQSKTLPQDIPNKLAAIDEVLDIFGFDRKLYRIIKRGRALRAIWEQEISQGRRDQYFESIKRYREDFLELMREIKVVHDKNERYTDIKDILSKGDLLSKWEASKYVYSMSEFIDNMKRIDPNPTPNNLQLFKPYADKFRVAINELEEWRKESNEALLTIRREISN